MTKITIDPASLEPCSVNNWAKEYNIGNGKRWDEVKELFHKTTKGKISYISANFTYELVFENDSDAICFILRYT
jgi:hypothetical protein